MKTNDWYLSFVQSRPTVMEGYELKSAPIAIDEYERALSAAADAPMTRTEAPYTGNPRDFYSREITLVSARGGQIRIEARLQQSALSPEDPSPILGDTVSVVLRPPEASYSAKLAAWRALRDELATVGLVDRTVDTELTSIAEEARAAGDLETATRLGVAIAEARQAQRELERARQARVEELRAQDATLAGHPHAPPAAVATPVPTTPGARPVEPARAPSLTASPRVTFRGGVLEVAYGALDAASLRALIERGEHRDATKVVLVGNPIGDEGVALLARSGGFPSVTELSLGASGLSDKGARALAQEAVGLDHLERLDLGEVPAESDRVGARDGSGVSDAGVEELARSPRLPALRTIDRGKEHRFVPGGREGRELIEIRRADGRVVESRITHSIWP